MEFPNQLRKIFTESLVVFFEQAGAPDINQNSSKELNLAAIDFYALIYFSGKQIAGNMMIGTSSTLLRETYPVSKSNSNVNKNFADWIGEISNQALGRFKNTALNYGIDISVSTPSVITGNKLVANKLNSDKARERIRFDISGQPLILDINVEILEKLSFDVPGDSESKSETEGSLFLF